MMTQISQIFDAIIQIYSMIILAWCVISFIPQIGPGHPAYQALQRLTAPVLNPLRRMLPTLGTIDLSPLFAFWLIGAVRNLVNDILR